MIWGQLEIGLIAFVPLRSLCTMFYVFSQERVLTAEHQGRTAEADGKLSWNKIITFLVYLGI